MICLNYNHYLVITKRKETWILVFSSGNELERIQENLVAPAEKMSTDMDVAAGLIHSFTM